MSITGVESLIKKLNALGGNANKVLETSIAKQTKLVQGEAKDLCPVDSGDLRKNIFTDVKSENDKITGKVFTNIEYAPYVEFGTGKKGEDSSGDKYPGPLSYKQDKWRVNIPDVGVRWIEGQPAQPFLYPALKNNEDLIKKNIKVDLKKEIERLCKK
ncbi:MAG: HK97 gp10 family phage protein [Clostridium sp.]|uniref:HK97-gp10 family putative phage morphogenesis protein n=1 Tax=Clostridium sp. TaxID=1506 RepID=UPI002A874B8A|nr:HK97 gp10 family phage protein [Clostridium sp.]MDY5096698.1 HK97-gp10 family putative phage morphogenesis protein [Clostridium sp.]